MVHNFYFLQRNITVEAFLSDQLSDQLELSIFSACALLLLQLGYIFFPGVIWFVPKPDSISCTSY